MTTFHTLDLELMGGSGIIAAFAVPCGEGRVALFETGPASTTGSVEAGLAKIGLGVADIQAIFVTHVHLDHSGAAGDLSAAAGCPVYAHPAGVPHLEDPSKLLASAERIYGDMLVAMWGVTREVPQAQTHAVGHGETVQVGGLSVRGWHTPGHASHHVAWQLDDAVVTGDVGGVRFQPATHVLPPMPPPDIDVELWLRSLDLIRGLGTRRLLLTHYGAFKDVNRHLDELGARLLEWTTMARSVKAEGGDRNDLVARLEALDGAELSTGTLGPEVVARYQRLCPMNENSAGLWRYVNRVG